MLYFGFMPASLFPLEITNAPLCEIKQTGDTLPFGNESLYSGMNIVS